jgi:undecaprenyl-diphosphatase
MYKPNGGRAMEQKPPMEEQIQGLAKQAQQGAAGGSFAWHHVIKPDHLLLALYALMLFLFGLLAWFVHLHPVLDIDLTITRTLQANRSLWLSALMLAVGYPGSTLTAGLVLLTAGLFWIVRLRLEALFVIAVSVTSAMLNALMKLLVARPRPTPHLVEVMQPADGTSFPSGQVMAYIALWGLLFCLGGILLRGKAWQRLPFLVVAGLLVVLIGPSRIYMGEHWASDVLGSYLLGGAWLGLSLWLYLKLKRKR